MAHVFPRASQKPRRSRRKCYAEAFDFVAAHDTCTESKQACGESSSVHEELRMINVLRGTQARHAEKRTNIVSLFPSRLTHPSS